MDVCTAPAMAVATGVIATDNAEICEKGVRINARRTIVPMISPVHIANEQSVMIAAATA